MTPPSTGDHATPSPTLGPLWDIHQLPRYLGLTRQAIYQRRHRGDFPAAIKVGASLRWRAADIERWLADQHEGPSQ